MECVLCGGKTVFKKVAVEELGRRVGVFDAGVCLKCGERYYSEEIMRKIQKREKAEGMLVFL
ncbi:MAG: YgiT-type zinc finger protein [Candidatus Micrarchaeota archaeon]